MKPLPILLCALALTACSKTSTEPTPRAPVSTITVTASPTTLASLGETSSVTATALDASGNTISGVSFSWSTSDASVATISGGTATATGNGTATLTAQADGVSGSVDVTVQQVATAAAVTPSDSVYKSAAQLVGSAVDARGNPVQGAVTWTSLTPGVVTVDGSGALTPVSTGVARIVVQAGTFVDTATVRMVWNVSQLSDLFPLTEYVASVGGRSVYSDLSQAHADEHMAILDDAWTYLTTSVFPNTSLAQKDFFFTAWAEIWVEYSPFCGGVFLENQTLWQRCVSPYPLSFLTPEQDPDFRNILRFLTHEVMRFTYAETDAFPWFKEGLAYWYGAGSFDAGGDLVVTRPEDILITDFQTGDSQDILEALDALSSMPLAEYYANVQQRTPVAVRMAQSTMLVAYLVLNHPTAVTNALAGLDSGTITTNDALIASILADTGLTIGTLETAYLAYARGL